VSSCSEWRFWKLRAQKAAEEVRQLFPASSASQLPRAARSLSGSVRKVHRRMTRLSSASKSPTLGGSSPATRHQRPATAGPGSCKEVQESGKGADSPSVLQAEVRDRLIPASERDAAFCPSGCTAGCSSLTPAPCYCSCCSCCSCQGLLRRQGRLHCHHGSGSRALVGCQCSEPLEPRNGATRRGCPRGEHRRLAQVGGAPCRMLSSECGGVWWPLHLQPRELPPGSGEMTAGAPPPAGPPKPGSVRHGSCPRASADALQSVAGEAQGLEPRLAPQRAQSTVAHRGSPPSAGAGTLTRPDVECKVSDQ